MKKKLIIGFAILAVILIIGAIFLGKKQAPSSGTVGGGTPPPSGTGGLPPPPPPPTGDTITLGTSAGSVTLPNFYRTAEGVSDDKTSVFVKTASDYVITYYAPDSTFFIGIEATPVPNIIPQAEAAFLDLLHVNKVDACKLKVIVAVPASVDPNYASQQFGLSFCGSPAR